MKIIYTDNGLRNYIDEPIYSYNGNISIEIRGNTSQAFPKKQYAIETCDSSGENLNVKLLDLPEENDWILYAPYSDKSLIRNVLAYQMARQTGQYASRSRFCELVLNDEYMGIYVLFEKIKRDEFRVNISKLSLDGISGDDATGGYILEIDRKKDAKSKGFYSTLGTNYYQYRYPNNDDIKPEQETYIRNFIGDFEIALFSENFQDPLEGYYRFIEMNSFIDYMIVNEVAKNIDAYRLSTFMYKTKDSKGGKLHMGPVWDFNIAFGNSNYQGGYHSDSLVTVNHPWWPRLAEDSVFTNALQKRWNDLRLKAFSNETILHTIDSLTQILSESHERNFTRWDIIGHNVWPNYYVGESYTQEINFLKSWIIDRLHWLDENLPRTPDVKNTEYELSSNTILLKAYPNPFEFDLTLAFELEEPGVVSLKLYDIMGQLQGIIISEEFYDQGMYTKRHSPASGVLYSLPKGIYFLVMEIDNQLSSRIKIVKN